jgi:thymidylate synthase
MENQRHGEHQYLEILKKIVESGHLRETRNSKTLSMFSARMEFDLADGFPLLTTKKCFLRGIFEELIHFFLLGKTDSKILEKKGVTIWKANSNRAFLDHVGLNHYREGDIGALYGYNFLHYGHPYEGCDMDYTGKGFDQVSHVIDLIKHDPYSRRIMMTSFNPATVQTGCLAPCHSIVVQFYMEKDDRLSCQVYNRSQDFFLGNPFNIASAALQLILFCEIINNDPTYIGIKPLVPGRVILVMGDCHIYEEHIEAAKIQLSREPFPFPTIKINKKFTKFEELEFNDIELIGYQSHPTIKAEMIA